MTSAPGTAPEVEARRRRLTPAVRDQLTVLTPLLVSIAVVGVYATIASPFFLTTDNATNITRQVAALLLIALAQTPLMIAGQLDLSVASAASLATVIAALLLKQGLPESAVVPIVIGIGALIGFLTGLIVARTRVQPFILTLGLLSVLIAIANILSNNRQVSAGDAFTWLSVGKVAGLPIPAILVALVAIVLGLMLRYAKLGRYAFATGSNEQAAFLSGVPTDNVKIALYTLNQAIVAMAGLMLVGRLGGGDPQAAAGLELQAVTAVVLGGAALSGGRGSIIGTLLGVLLIGLISNALNVAGVKQSYLQLIYGAVLMLSVVYSSLVGMYRRRRVPAAARPTPPPTERPATTDEPGG